jgi:NAD+ kinase
MPFSVGLITHVRREPALACALAVREWLRERGAQLRVQPEAAELLGCPELAAGDEAIAGTHFILSLGGDGTLLAASHIAAQRGTPILGIHVGGPGSFGFLTEATPATAFQAVERVLAGDYRLDERMMVAAEVIRDGTVVGRFDALNDLVIRGALARMLKMHISVDDTFLATYAADGIIAATPTGSTAYNLAAGGPLVHPTLQVVILTPICPHTLNVRSLIINDEEYARIELQMDPRDAALLTVDGQTSFDLHPDDTVLVRRAEVVTRLISLDTSHFYRKLQSRLRLGERFGS